MKFNLSKGPYLRSRQSTTKKMLALSASLLIVWIASIVSHSLVYEFYYGMMAFLIGLTSLVTTFLVDILMAFSKGKRGKEIFKFTLKSYSYVTALIFALCLPVGTPLYVVAIGAIVGTLIGKHLFGGFGFNIFNPAAIGRVFVGLSFATKLTVPNVSMYDLSAGATVTGAANWTNIKLPGSYMFKDLFLGGYPSALGESFTILLLIIGLFLIITGIANWRLMVTYLLTISLTALGLSFAFNTGNEIFYVLKHVLTGGILFGTVFMITDPVTAPKDPYGKILYAIGAGFLTMLIRVNSSYPEGMAFSLLIMNILVPTIDSLVRGVTSRKTWLKYSLITSFLVISCLLNVVIAKNITFNEGTAYVNSESNIVLRGDTYE